jgi:Uncharacterised protein family UPF0047
MGRSPIVILSTNAIVEAMKSYRKELWFNVPSRRGFVNITPEIETCLRESGVKEGLVLCNAMHITIAVALRSMSKARVGMDRVQPSDADHKKAMNGPGF